jgi:hypothetical protein
MEEGRLEKIKRFVGAIRKTSKKLMRKAEKNIGKFKKKINKAELKVKKFNRKLDVKVNRINRKVERINKNFARSFDSRLSGTLAFETSTKAKPLRPSFEITSKRSSSGLAFGTRGGLAFGTKGGGLAFGTRGGALAFKPTASLAFSSSVEKRKKIKSVFSILFSFCFIFFWIW